MKIEEIGKKLVIDFAESEEKRRGAFFYGLSGIPFSEWLSDTQVSYDPTVREDRVAYLQMRRIQNVAKTHKVPITEEACMLIETYRERYEAEEIARMEQEAMQAKRERAQAKLKHGCTVCEELEWNREQKRYVCKVSGMVCENSMEETEMLLELWKESRVFRRNTPFPNQACKYLEVLI